MSSPKQESIVPQLSISDITLSPAVTAETAMDQATDPVADPVTDQVTDHVASSSTDSKAKVTSVVINVTDGSSFDKAFRAYKVKERSVRTFSAQNISEIHRALAMTHDERSKATPSFSVNIMAICDEIAVVGFSNTTLNFECCSSYCGRQLGVSGVSEATGLCSASSAGSSLAADKTPGQTQGQALGLSLAPCVPCTHPGSVNYFIDHDTTKSVVKFIVFMLKQGTQVICSDFSLKALIASWDPELFGAECPFENVSTTSGQIRVRYGIDVCKASVFPQMASLAMMALPDRADASASASAKLTEGDEKEVSVSSITMDAMGSTIVYRVLPKIDPSLKVEVLSVAVGQVSGVKEMVPSKTVAGVTKRSATHDAVKPLGGTLAPLAPLTSMAHLGALAPPLSHQKLKRQNAFVADFIDPQSGKVHLIQSSGLEKTSSIGVPTVAQSGKSLFDLPKLNLPKISDGTGPSTEQIGALGAVGVFGATSALGPASPLANENKDVDKQDSLFPPLSFQNPPEPLGLVRTQTIPFEPARKVNTSDLTREIVKPFPVTDGFCKASGTNNLTGLPVHSVVTFRHFPGSLVVSSMHLSNLLQVNTDIRSVVSVASQVLGRQRSAQIEEQLTVAQQQGPALLRAMTSSLVAEIASSSSNMGHPSGQTGGQTDGL
ncbi:hypothetical protein YASMINEVIRUS_1200 [Yasminevirus sp. GU-2018]|uniref:Uncharacterized protein n=1 Tax=Yasminevirus sp. GU-2018 TaxID=2420051 RepID=A0A5K0U948_9VIRU|nr:hypothetical protein YASMINEVIRUS_1200 [Yasminevirus sp. GU-2018]